MSLQAPILAQRWLVLTRSLLAGFTRPLTRCSAGTGISTLKSMVNPWADVSAAGLDWKMDFMNETKRDRNADQTERQRRAPKDDVWHGARN